uniref:Reverse transcriptase/retrotransposon-derived protein RNase H-like domain-containing protein n=1 Tax=Oryzias sinensis TaxID=183150 RepID=A0A8C7ZZC5_9TELE
SDKCIFGLQQIEILGHVITAEGIKPDPKKVEAISKAPRPENVQLLRSFLGTCGFLMKCIPNYANLSEPLRKLTRKGQVWEWTNEAESSFQVMKEALVSEPCLAYFKLGAPTVVISDASPVGLDTVSLQTQQDGRNKPVAYASHSLTPTERRYSQIEREALGCTGTWPNPVPVELQPFNRCAKELCTYDGLLLRGHRIVLPREMVR